MKAKTFKVIVTVLVFTAIPSFLSYLATSDYFFDYLKNNGIIGESINISFIQDLCLWLSIILSAILLSYNLADSQIKYNHILEQRDLLVKMSKDILKASLEKNFSKDLSEFDIRIFIPKHPKLYKIYDWINYKKYKKAFVIKNISQIAQEGITKNLEFQVSPNCEGLVGICYNKQALVYDDNLENTNSSNYNMNSNQVSRTNNLQWSICCPIFDNSNNVVAILALDGTKKATINKNKETDLSKQIIAFSRLLYDAVPQLFKK